MIDITFSFLCKKEIQIMNKRTVNFVILIFTQMKMFSFKYKYDSELKFLFKKYGLNDNIFVKVSKNIKYSF